MTFRMSHLQCLLSASGRWEILGLSHEPFLQSPIRDDVQHCSRVHKDNAKTKATEKGEGGNSWRPLAAEPISPSELAAGAGSVIRWGQQRGGSIVKTSLQLERASQAGSHGQWNEGMCHFDRARATDEPGLLQLLAVPLYVCTYVLMHMYFAGGLRRRTINDGRLKPPDRRKRSELCARLLGRLRGACNKPCPSETCRHHKPCAVRNRCLTFLLHAPPRQPCTHPFPSFPPGRPLGSEFLASGPQCSPGPPCRRQFPARPPDGRACAWGPDAQTP